MGVVEDVLAGIIGTISDIALSLLTPVLHVPTYVIGALVNSGLCMVMPLIHAINYVGSSVWSLLTAVVSLLIWLPPWLYVPIAGILILRAVMAVVAIATKIVDTLMLRGWL